MVSIMNMIARCVRAFARLAAYERLCRRFAPCLSPGLPPRDVTERYRYRAGCGGHDAQEVLFANKYGLAAVLLLALVPLLAVFGSVAFLAALEALAIGLWEVGIRAVTRAMCATTIRAL